MIRIGVGVEGPSDKKFWSRFLHRTFPGRGFDVRSMRGRPKLIRDAPRLLDTFRDTRRAAGIIILDLDDNPCVGDVRELFDQRVKSEFQRPLEDRYLHLCVAMRDLESWFLADYEALREGLPAANYKLPGDTRVWGSAKLKELWKQQYGGRSVAFNKIDFANRIAPVFSVERAREHSASLRIGWERIRIAVGEHPEENLMNGA